MAGKSVVPRRSIELRTHGFSVPMAVPQKENENRPQVFQPDGVFIDDARL